MPQQQQWISYMIMKEQLSMTVGKLWESLAINLGLRNHFEKLPAVCELAIVAGVNAMLTPRAAYNYAIMSLTSPTGRCRTFDHRADGLVRSEGCGPEIQAA